MLFRPWFLTLMLCAAPAAAQASGPLGKENETFKAVAAADAALFGATNRCDLETLGRYVADDLEFYHDVTELSVGKADLIAKTRSNICGKMIRELVPGSLTIYPLPGYGAIETGTHRFLHPAEPNNIGEAQFIHVWRHIDGSWQLARVLSYDH